MTEITADEFEALKERVAQLEKQLEYNGTSGSSGGVYDRYDEYVLGEVESAHNAPPRRLMKLYETAGVVNKNKQKKRAKRLRRLESENE